MSTSAPNPNCLRDIIAQLESNHEPSEEHSFRAPFLEYGRELHEAGVAIPAELLAEEIAFSVHAHDRQDASVWGVYFGPMMSWRMKDGGSVDDPPLDAIGPEVLAQWRRRATESQHPVMRARYSDLLWELPKCLEDTRPDAEMARRAIDAYLDAVATRRYEHDTTCIDKASRALTIALQVSDPSRVALARDTLVALEDAIAQDDMLGLWGFSFDLLVEPPNANIPVSDTLRDRLISDLESRLVRVAQREGDGYHPIAVENAALRLAQHYRRRGRREDVARVMRTYAAAVQRMTATGSAMLRANSLERLYDQLLAQGMRADASSLDGAIRLAGEASLKEMKSISVPVEIETEKVEAYFAAMLAGNSESVLARIAVHFIPRRAELEAQMRSLAEKAPLSSLMSHIVKDDDGRTVARIGPLAVDLEGNLLSHIGQVLHLSSPWLHDSLARGRESGACVPDKILAFMTSCPLFVPGHHALIDAGLQAWGRGEYVSAIHILVPQIEECVRQVAIAIGAPLYVQRRGGGLNVRTLDELLRDSALEEALGHDVTTYLRVLLTDARGWNVRNRVCHGLAPSTAFGPVVADRLVHTLLMLSLLRFEDEVGDATASS